MIPLIKLRAAVREALVYVSAQPGVDEVEVFASANTNLTVRLNYTSNIPSNGVEEPKSLESYGIGLRVAFRTPEGVKTGFGSEPADLTLTGVQSALEKARSGAVLDVDFESLPRPDDAPRSVADPRASSASTPAPRFHDPSVMRMGNSRLVETGWNMLERGLDVFETSEDVLSLVESPERISELGLILGGDLVCLQERMAIASTHMPRVQSDESTLVMSFATAMVESQAAKGSGWSVSSGLAGFRGDSAAQAARNAIASIDGVRIPTGDYRVVLGPQPLAEILEWILLPGFSLDMFWAGASPFMGKLNQQVASPQLSIYDHGAAADMAGSKKVTDEGLPTGRTQLIANGVLSGLMSDHYNYRRIISDPEARRKLGVDPRTITDAIAPRNGFRPGNGGGRDFASTPSVVPTNLVVQGDEGITRDELFRRVGDGVYIGRIWYTYPVNGITAGDFSGTVIGDSFLIKDGRLAAPIKANTLRMNDNVLRVINNILGITEYQRGTVRWSSDQVTWAPEVAVSGFHLEQIGEQSL